MLNAVWIAMVVGSLLCGAFTGRLSAVTQASTDGAKNAVELVVGLVGVIAFWLGLVRVLEAGGLLRWLSRAIQPITKRLFPEVPTDHPAMGMIVMNLAANVLGLGNAATPFGLKAMVELDKLNRQHGTATNAMALFLAINTSSVSIIPTTMIALRSTLGSHSPGSILLPTLVATSCSTTVAIVMAKLLQRLPRFALPAPDPTPAPAIEQHPDAPADAVAEVSSSEADAKPPGPVARWVRVAGTALAVASVGAVGYALSRKLSAGPGDLTGAGLGEALRTALADWALLLLIVAIVLYGMMRGVKVYDVVANGGREAFQITLSFVPYFIVILVAISMLRASGGIDLLVKWLEPITSLVGMPGATLPMALLRPLSGSGALGVAADIMKKYGPDSLIGQIVSTMQGSTETTFYVLALYFGAARIRNGRHTVLACLVSDAAGMLGAVWACRLLL